MEKAQYPLIAALDLGDTDKSTASTTSRKFSGTDNPRHLRVLHSLTQRPRKREEIDRIAGASNGPEIIAELRRRGLELPCHRVPCIDRDGFVCRAGIYSATPADIRAIHKSLTHAQPRSFT